VCRPDDGNPIRESPAAIRDPLMTCSLSTTPTMKPARSYSPVGRDRHLGRLAADQGAAGFAAAARQPVAMSTRRSAGSSHGDIVEKEERDRSLDQDVVDAVIDQVETDAPVVPGRDRDLELVPTPSVLLTRTDS